MSKSEWKFYTCKHREYIWKYNFPERALILFLSYYFFKTWYHIAIKIHDAITIQVDLFLSNYTVQ